MGGMDASTGAEGSRSFVCQDAPGGYLLEPRYLTEPRAPVPPTVDELVSRYSSCGAQLYQGVPEEQEIMNRCGHYISGLLAQPARVVGSWSLLAVNEWSRKQQRVLVLTTRSIFRVTFDRKHNKIESYKETALENVLGIVAHHTDFSRFKIFSAVQDGGRNIKQFFKGSTFNSAMSKVTARAYIVTVPDTGPSSGASAAADGNKALLEAFQAVHKIYADAHGSPWQHAQ